jgi:hypothetical protein
MRVFPHLCLSLCCLMLGACAGYQDQLQRGQRYYERNDFEVALALWRSLEPNTSTLRPHDQTRYAYLRGMTDYRLGFNADARHWLARARANEVLHPGGLPNTWATRLDETLKTLRNPQPGTRRPGEPVQTIEALP